jgi:hypothetical protein
MSKVKIRLMAGSENEIQKLRRHFLKKHPQLILSHPHEGPRTTKKKPNWFCYGDYEFGKIRRRRGE